MLTLAGSLRIDRFSVYRDVVRRADTWVTTSTFYVIPDSPTIAVDPNDLPLFDFLWYRTPPGVANGTLPAAGGMLTVTVTLAPTAPERAHLGDRLKEIARAEGLSDVEMRSVPVLTGVVALALAGETGQADFARNVAGAGPVSMSGAERASFAVELTREGAALMWAALENRRDVLHARYDLSFQHRLGDVELRVWCEAQQAHRATAARLTTGAVDPPTLRQELQAKHLAGIELRSETPLEPSHRAALEKVGASVLEAALADAMFAFDQPAAGAGLTSNGRVGALRPFHETMTASLNMTFRESYPVEAHAVLQNVLPVGRSLTELADRVKQIDLRGETQIIVGVTFFCTADFAHDLIDLVKVRLIYEGIASTGPIRRGGEVIFKDGQDVGHVRFDIAAVDQRAYRYEVDVYYDGSPAPTRLAFGPTEDTLVALDVDALGVLAVTVELGDVSFEHVHSIIVDLEHPPSRQSARIALDGAHESGAWRVIVRDAPAEYRRRTTWITADGRRIEEGWQTSRTPRVRLNMPPTIGIAARRTVQLVAAGDFRAVAQIVVALRLTAAVDAPRAEYAFTAAAQTASWDLALDPGAPLRYQVLRTIVRPDGTRRESGWEDSAAPVFLVRDDARHQVDIVTRLLRFSADAPLMLLALEPVDGLVTERTTLPLRDGLGATWSFAVSDPARHRYRYQLTVVRRDGQRAPQPWAEAETEVLVLRPPA